MVRNWYQNLDNKLTRECVRFKINHIKDLRKDFEVIQNLRSLETSSFDPSTPTCLSLLILHVPPLSTYVCLRELTHPQKRYCNAFEFSNEKSGSEKREKNYFFW